MATSARVAPDFDARARFNTLRVKPEYRITLRLGEIEKLFRHPPGSLEGRMERLQVLGLFYFPLTHAKAAERFERTWAWVRARVFARKGEAPKSETEADAIIQAALKCRIVGGAAPADWNGAPSELPPDAADPARPEEANFAKIRLPGGYTTDFSAHGGIEINLDRKRLAVFPDHPLFEVEERFYLDNPALGKLPLVAKVERRPPGGGDWAPAADVVVHVRLVPAFEPPAYDPGRPANGQFHRPPLRTTNGGRPEEGAGLGPQKRYDAGEGYLLDTQDPRGRNCHKEYGGRRGAGLGTQFRLEDTPGFPYAAPEEADAHAVKTKTNKDGEAGVVFMPSRQGGDRYRLRAYLPISGDGESPGSVAATTGTFVVWRNIRISRLIRHEVSPVPDKRLVDEAFAHGIHGPDQYLKVARAHGDNGFTGLDRLNLGLSDGTTGGRTYDPMPRQFARAFCELELDSDAEETMTAADFEAAQKLAIEDAKTGLRLRAKQFLKINLIKPEVLYCGDLKFQGPESTVCTLPMRAPWEYNEAVPPKHRLNIYNVEHLDFEIYANLTQYYALGGFMRHFSHDGALPGLTLIQSAMGFTWQLFYANKTYAGLQQNFRGCFLWYGADAFTTLCYDCTSNACHEIGHAMFMPHAPTFGDKQWELAAHDAFKDCVCVMSYDPSTGQYCGKSLLSLRGWNIVAMT